MHPGPGASGRRRSELGPTGGDLLTSSAVANRGQLPEVPEHEQPRTLYPSVLKAASKSIVVKLISLIKMTCTVEGVLLDSAAGGHGARPDVPTSRVR